MGESKSPSASREPGPANEVGSAEDPTHSDSHEASPAQATRLPPHTRKALIKLASLLAGLGFIVAGLQLFQTETLTRPDFLETLNQHFRLDFNNLANILQGLAFVAIGTFLIVRTLRFPGWLTVAAPEIDLPGFDWASLAPSRGWLAVSLAAAALVTLQLPATGFQTQSAVLWVGAIALAAIAMYRWDIKRGARPTFPLAKGDGYWILGLTLLASFIFVYRLEDVPSVLIGDEAAFFQHAQDLMTREGPISPFGFATYSFPALGTYGQSFFLWAFGPSLWSWRLASAAPAVLAIPGIYLLGKVLFERRIAITASVLYSALPFALSYGRMGYNTAQVLPIVALGSALFLLGERQRSATWLFAAGVVAGLGFLTYTAGRILTMTVFAYLLYRSYLALRQRSPLHNHLIALSVFTAATAITTAPHLLHGLQAQSTGLVSKVGESTFTNQQYVMDFFRDEFYFAQPSTTTALGYDQVVDFGLTLRLIVRGTVRTALAFLLGGFFHKHFLVGPLAGEIGAVFLPLALVVLFRMIRRPPAVYLLLWFFLSFFMLSALNSYPPRPGHLIGVLPLIPLLVAVGLVLTVDSVVSALPRLGITGSRLLLLVAALVISASGLHAYFVTMPEEYPPDIESAMAWSGLANPGRLIVYAHSDPAREEHTPFVFLKMAPEVRFMNILLGPETDTLPQLPATGEVELYVEERDYSLVRRPVRQRWGDSLRVTTYRDPQGHPRIRLLKNGPFNVGPSTDLFSILTRSYILSPFRWIALAFVGAAVLLRLGLPPFATLKDQLLRALIWLTEPPQGPR